MNQATDRPVTLGFPFKLEYVKMVVIIGETTKVSGEKTHGALYIMVALLISVISLDTGLPGALGKNLPILYSSPTLQLSILL